MQILAPFGFKEGQLARRMGVFEVKEGYSVQKVLLLVSKGTIPYAGRGPLIREEAGRREGQRSGGRETRPSATGEFPELVREEWHPELLSQQCYSVPAGRFLEIKKGHPCGCP